MYWTTFSSSIHKSCQLVFISGGPENSELNRRSPVGSEGSNLETVLAWFLPPTRCGKHPTLMVCIPQTLLEEAGFRNGRADRVGLNCCSGFMLFTGQPTQEMVVGPPVHMDLSSKESNCLGYFYSRLG